MGPIGLTSKRCSTDYRSTELRRFDKLQMQNIHFKVNFLICVSRTRVRVRDGDIHVNHGCWRRNIGDNLKILMTNLMKYRGRIDVGDSDMAMTVMLAII